MGEKHSIALMIRDEVLPRSLEYYLRIETGGLPTPVFVEPPKEPSQAGDTKEQVLKQLKGNKKKEETKTDHDEKEEKARFCPF